MGRLPIRRAGRIAVVLMAGACAAACATLEPRYAAHGVTQAQAPKTAPGPRAYKTGAPYQVGGIWYTPREQPNYDQRGVASWYGDAFHMKATANGEIFDMEAISAAHTTLPLPCIVEVTNLDNGRKLQVRVNDRGPFVGDRIIDLSRAAARELGYDRKGLANVRVRYLGPAPLAGPAAGLRYAQAIKPNPSPFPATPVAPVTFAAAPTTPIAIQTASLPPATPISPVFAVASDPTPLPELIPEPVSAFRIQAGAFGDEANARRAQAQLSAAGVAVIEPIERAGLTLYRVVLPAPGDEAQAFALRDRVAQIGFADARVVRAF